jgi:hypothetical protein
MQVIVTAGHYVGESGVIVASPPSGWVWWTVKVSPTWGKPVDLCLRADEFEVVHGG